jgi:hypothetical protein
MRSIDAWTAAAAAVVIAGSASAATAPAAKPAVAPAKAAAPACNRACLVGILDKWFDALVAHSARGLPLAKDVRFTEQAARLPIGDGLFISATEGPGKFKIVAADPVSGQVGAIVMMKQWGKPIEMTVRLKVVGGRIVEAEQIYAADLRPTSMANLEAPRPALLEDLPASERTSRAQMLAAAFSYFDAIEQDSGDVAPFAADCERHENGMQTTSQKTPQATPIDGAAAGANSAFSKLGQLGCRDGLNTHSLEYITMIRPRHLYIVDEQKGLVLGFPRFVHRGNVRYEKVVGVAGLEGMPMSFGPNDLQASEMFKVRKGKLVEIEATGFINAYMAPTGWDDRYPERYKYAVTHPKTHPYNAGASFPAAPASQRSSEAIER